MTRIGKPWTVVGQFLSTTEGVNLPKVKFIDVVTRLKTDDAEFSYLLDLSS
jgi:hypothetical protein